MQSIGFLLPQGTHYSNSYQRRTHCSVSKRHVGSCPVSLRSRQHAATNVQNKDNARAAILCSLVKFGQSFYTSPDLGGWGKATINTETVNDIAIIQ